MIPTSTRPLLAALAQMAEGVIVADADGTLVFVNAAAARMHGIDTIGVGVEKYADTFQLFTEGGSPYPSNELPLARAVLRGESVVDERWRIRRPDGREILTIGSARPVFDEAGVQIAAVLTMRDDSARDAHIRANLARERTIGLQALTAALSQASTIHEVAEAIVAHADAILGAVGIVVASPEPNGEHLELVCASHMPDELREAWKRFPISAPVPIGDVARSGEPLYIPSRVQLQELYPNLVEPFERAGHHATSVLPLVSNDRLHGVIGAAFETSQPFDEDYRAVAVTLARLCAQALERARLYESEHIARASAELANRAKSEFLAVMSHELRTPLNAIGGYAELIELGIRGPVTDEMRKDLQRIQKSQRHLLGLVNGVLNYSRVEAGAVTYDLQDVMLDEVLASCEALVAPQIRNKKLSLTYEATEPHIHVRADTEKLQQVLLNLLTNAIKFTEPGGKLELSCETAGDEVRVSVSDTGRGIAEHQLGRVFEPFVQVDARLTRTQEGVGLGLAISRDLARGMGGDLTVESRLGQGSIFTLSLPLPRDAG